jgi:hypothetical protein
MDTATQNLALALAELLQPQRMRPLRPQDEAFELKARREEAAGRERERLLLRTYHMGTKPTLGLEYDDRLYIRLNCCASTAYAYLDLYQTDPAGLRHTRAGKKYLITEQAVREWLGDLKAAA